MKVEKDNEISSKLPSMIPNQETRKFVHLHYDYYPTSISLDMNPKDKSSRIKPEQSPWRENTDSVVKEMKQPWPTS